MVGMWFSWTVVRAPVPAPEPIAALTVGVTEEGVALVCFGAGGAAHRAQLAEAGRRLGVNVGEPARADGGPVAEVAAQLTDYLAGRRRSFDHPVDWRLTHGDQLTVLSTLYRQVGYGQTITYGELAVRSAAYRTEPRVGARPGQAARRVGAIMGSNPLPVIVPCHRVLAADSLGGFGGGLDTKRWLLGLEGVLPPTLDLWPD
jgi:methylated-DNA-[protein]-cysteine S-methyltransferase